MYPLVKGMMDRVISLMALIVLSPLFLVLAVWIKLDSPGPVFFRQRRIGRFQKEFLLIKFRTMRVDTPSDVPTHQLRTAHQFITRSGRLLRKTSLDELPQLLNVLQGDMALVGPRPALYNQADLIALREARGVHRVLPGITGLAQIEGRDELSIPVKASIDGTYVDSQSFWLDLRILIRTVGAVLKTKGVAEGDSSNDTEDLS